MEAIDLYRTLYEAGLHVRADGDKLAISPKDRVTSEIRQLLRDHKPAMLAFLAEARRTSGELLEAAMAVCDEHGDSPAARADMERDCLAIPAHQRLDGLEHLRKQYPEPTNTLPSSNESEGGSSTTRSPP